MSGAEKACLVILRAAENGTFPDTSSYAKLNRLGLHYKSSKPVRGILTHSVYFHHLNCLNSLSDTSKWVKVNTTHSNPRGYLGFDLRTLLRNILV